MDAKARIRQLMDEREWSEYMLAIEAGLSQSTVANIFNRNTTPSIPTIEAICDAFGLTLAQFFSEGNLTMLTSEQQVIFQHWSSLNPQQKAVLAQLIDVMREE